MIRRDFDREKYRQQIRTNQLIGILLSLSGIALAVILWVIANALSG
ncbi:MAG: hypothetical protein ACI32N_08820 [Bulleidia sp.]